jgi:glycosyltransferase involved in cell wall biosynthesis
MTIGGNSVDSGEDSTPVGSIIIPAHNESAVITRCLHLLLEDLGDGVRVVVVANGCSDATADVARAVGRGVVVIEIQEASKPLALRAGETAAPQMPRIYLDADVQLRGRSARATLDALRDGAVAARPPAAYDTDGATWPVRSYYRARSVMPSLHRHVWGAGVYGLSAVARSRFDAFPQVVGDDLFVDRYLEPGELRVVDTEPVVVTTPRDSARLLRILRRAQKAKGEESGGSMPVESTAQTTLQDMRSVFLSQPRRRGDLLVYGLFALTARFTQQFAKVDWERDDSSRRLRTKR